MFLVDSLPFLGLNHRLSFNSNFYKTNNIKKKYLLCKFSVNFMYTSCII